MFINFFYSVTFFLSIIGQTGDQLYKATSDVNFREGPSTSYRVLDVIKKGDTIELLEETSTSWAKMKHKGRTGFTTLRFFQKVSGPPENIETSQSDLNQSDSDESVSQFWVIWFGAWGILSIIIFLLGKNKRNQTVSVLLSLFTGFIGLQKFYLGKFVLGMLCLVFFWTFIPLLVGFWDTVKLAFMPADKFQLKYSRVLTNETETRNRNTVSENLKMKRETEYSLNLQHKINSENPSKDSNNKDISTATNGNGHEKVYSSDSDIIDIDNEELDTEIPDSSSSYSIPQSDDKNKKYNSEISTAVPHWRMFYVYSYDAIRSASHAQKKFYKYFKDRLLNDCWTDLEGNTNYAFVLYFELLNEYEKHQDIGLLEKQLKLLGECCPATRTYSFSALVKLLNRRGDQYSKEKLEELRDPSMRYQLGFADYDPYASRLGRIYKEKLKLTKKHEEWLNKFYNPSNVFNSIEGCCVTIIHLFLNSLDILEEKLIAQQSTFEKELRFLIEQVEKTESSNDYIFEFNYLRERVEEEVFLVLFKRTENVIREEFHHKRKLSEEYSITEKDLNLKFEERLGSLFTEILNEERNSIANPDLDTQIALNEQNVSRWKVEFNNIKPLLKSNKYASFIKEIEQLEIANKKNPNIENIFFEASKAIAKNDKNKALEYYAKYISYDLNSDKIHNKKLTRTVQKSLFKNEEQLSKFERIIQDLINNQNLDETLTQLKGFYKPTRKKIVIAQEDFEEARAKHHNTVNILSDYLEDEEVEADEINESEGEVEMSFTNKQEGEPSIFLNEIGLNAIQENVLIKMADNSFSIEQNVIEQMALENGLMKNQLIDSINEICSDFLEGEFIIEEDENHYVIENSFYNELIK